MKKKLKQPPLNELLESDWRNKMSKEVEKLKRLIVLQQQ